MVPTPQGEPVPKGINKERPFGETKKEVPQALELDFLHKIKKSTKQTLALFLLEKY
jgi:hypothetical protein